MQLTDISGPKKKLAQFERVFVDPANYLARFLRITFYEVLNQYRNVLLPSPERRYFDWRKAFNVSLLILAMDYIGMTPRDEFCLFDDSWECPFNETIAE